MRSPWRRLPAWAAVALAVAACGGSTGTAGPNSLGGSPLATPPAGGWTMAGAGERLAGLDSYRFKMTLLGGDFATLVDFAGAGDVNAPIAVSGTIVNRPDKAMDILIGPAHIIDIGGREYFDESGTGAFVSTPADEAGVADTVTPPAMLAYLLDIIEQGSFERVGADEKNGVAADHYQAAGEPLTQLGPLTGVSGATWTADAWLANTGGHPVRLAVVGKSGGKAVYEILFDITNVNDPANSVAAPQSDT